MSYEIFSTPNFDKEFKVLVKKYPRIKDDIKELKKELQESPLKSDPLPKNCFKVRMKITGKSSGKRGGARIITFVKIIDEKVYLLSIYDKAEQANNEALDILLKQL